jgi:S-adenosylmethionine:tRNA ribosyltransferase-isomerase
MSEFVVKYGPWAIVAGASDGTGSAFATEIAARGVNVVLVARRHAALEEVAAGLGVEVGVVLADGRRQVRLLGDEQSVLAHGSVPLPPYITGSPPDPERYQTVYASSPGSVAAPTAGLHLTHGLLERCRRRGVKVARVDLAVGLDTFRPVTASTPEEHRIHSEHYRVPPETMRACARARRVVAVGTSTTRALESAAAGRLEGDTSLFIHGGYRFRAVDVLLTNFHLPRSTLLLLLAAFAGECWRRLYDTALAEGYRFLSFGDAMLVARA